MATEVTAVFPNETETLRASEALRSAGFHCEPKTYVSSFPTVRLDSQVHDRRMKTFALVGAAVGYAVGMLAVGHVAQREIMYLLIVPLSCTYWGLALGLFTAMGVARVQMLQAVPETSIISDHENSFCLEITAETREALASVEAIAAKFAATSVFLNAIKATAAEPIELTRRVAAEPIVLTKSA